jgi:hypothetical protein
MLIYKAPIRLFILLFLLLFTGNAVAQMLLVVDKPGSRKRFKYYAGDVIRVSTTNYKRPVEGIISHMTDSSLILNFATPVQLDSITIFHKQRYFVSLLTPIAWTAGAGYFIIDGINRTLNKEWPVISERTWQTSLVLFGAGAAVLPLRYSCFRISEEKWRIRILNLKDPQ